MANGVLGSWPTRGALDGDEEEDDEDRDLHDLMEHVVHLRTTVKSVVFRETCRACHMHRARAQAPPVVLPKCVLATLLHYLCCCHAPRDAPDGEPDDEALLRRQAAKPYTPECLSDDSDSSDDDDERDLWRVSLEARRQIQDDDDRDGDPLGTHDDFRRNLDRLFDLTDLEEEEEEEEERTVDDDECDTKHGRQRRRQQQCVGNGRTGLIRVYADEDARKLDLSVNGVWSRRRLALEVYRGAYDHRASLVYRPADRTLRLYDPAGRVVLLGPLWTSGLTALRRLADLVQGRDDDEHEVVFSHGQSSPFEPEQRQQQRDGEENGEPGHDAPWMHDERDRWRDTALLLAVLGEDRQARRLEALHQQRASRA